MKNKNTILSALLGAAFSVGSLNAAFVTDSDTFSGTVGDPTILVDLAQFDPILGTLISVLVTIEAETDGGQITFDNESGTGGSVTLEFGAELTGTIPDGAATIDIVINPVNTETQSVDSDNDGSPDFTGTDSFGITATNGSDSDDASPVNFGPYVGLGTFSVSIDNSVFQGQNSSGAFGPLDVTAPDFSGTVTVRYDYNVIPEPSTALGLALAGGLFFLRRRRS